MILSRQQEMVLKAFEAKGELHISQLSGIYTTSEALKDCLKRLVSLGLIKMTDYSKFKYVGGKE